MADAYTSTSALGLDQAAYDLAIRKPLRSKLYFDPIANVKPAASNQTGSSVVFRTVNDLAIATTPLSETVDLDAVALTDATVTLALAEYGNAVLRTMLAELTAYAPLSPEIANRVGYNAGLSQDTLAAVQLVAGTSVIRGTGDGSAPASRVATAATDTLSPNDVRRAVALLRSRNVDPLPQANDAYIGFIHPDVVYDFQSDTGAAGWLQPANYSDVQKRWNGEIGTFHGVRFIQRAGQTLATDPFVFVNAGADSTVDVYATVIVGNEALAKTWAPGLGPMPVTRVVQMADKLQRFKSFGWYWVGAYGRFNENALVRIESASSIGTNV